MRALREYTQKYITPFISMPLPDEYSGYQQLEYLYCISLENKEVPFGQILRDSYPLVFSFRGCMKSELTSVYPHWRPGMLTESLYNSYYKLVEGLSLEIVDDSAWKKPEEIKKEIREKYQEYRTEKGREPHFLECIIRWNA